MREIFFILLGVMIYAVACSPPRRIPASLPFGVEKFLDVNVTCYVRGEQGISCVQNR